VRQLVILAAGLAGLLAVSTATSAQQAKTPPGKKADQTMSIAATVAGETRTRVAYFWSVNPDCSLTGPTTVRIVTPPANGVAEVDIGPAFPAFAKDNVRYKCNQKQYDLPRVWYASKPGYRGPDALAIEVFYPTGAYRKARVTVTVK